MSLLIGHILQEAWERELNVISVVGDPDQVEPARTYLEQVTDLARLPGAHHPVGTNVRLPLPITACPATPVLSCTPALDALIFG
jgi:hypothetical protein